MAKTALVFAPLTAEHVITVMAHAVVILAGWDPTVVLVFN